MSLKAIGSALTTGLLVVCALTVTGLSIKREFGSPPPARKAFDPAPDWRGHADRGQVLGPSGAPVALIEYADYQCPACKLLETRIAEARKSVGAPFTIVFRHLPLDIHPFARASALASECAARQGRFAEMHQALFGRQKSIGVITWDAFAHDAGIEDLRQFRRCMRDSLAMGRLREDSLRASGLEASGTPTILIAGVRLSGAPPQLLLDSLIKASLRLTR